VGKFAAAEQQIAAGIDWARLLGVAKPPAWTALAPKAGATAIALKKSVQTTRVLVLIQEKIEGGNPVAEPPVSAAVSQALQRGGFDLQSAKAFTEKVGAEKMGSLSDDQLKDAAKGIADVVVYGTVTSRYSSNFGSTTVWHRARAEVRAIDLATGQWCSPRRRRGEEQAPGRAEHRGAQRAGGHRRVARAERGEDAARHCPVAGSLPRARRWRVSDSALAALAPSS